jgi:hypothetical protein
LHPTIHDKATASFGLALPSTPSHSKLRTKSLSSAKEEGYTASLANKTKEEGAVSLESNKEGSAKAHALQGESSSTICC